MRPRVMLSAALIPVLALAVATPAPAAGKAAAERKAVLGVIDQTFAAMSRHDAAAMRGLLVPGAMFAVLGPDGRVKMERDEDFLQMLGSRKGDWRERIWSPKVLIGDGLAQVWAPYDFHLDGKFSHCGIDSFALVKDGSGQWRISGITYNVQIDGCPTDPKTRARAAAGKPPVQH
ncbi:MAG TPA: nuclear transport factor 2 family protein [Dyella sp.]|nr:nuclear transport factor 2 family protein [Dyella sp.]